MNTHHAVAGIRLSIQEFSRLFNIGDRIHPKSPDALFDPEIRHIDHSPSHLGVCPVKIRLFRKKGMKIILAALFIVFPGRSAENAAPVGRRAPVFLRITPDIPVAFVVALSGRGLRKPCILVGGMIENKIHDDADAAFICLRNQLVHILHGAIGGIDIIIVCNIISVIRLRGNIAGSEPDGANSQIFQVIELRDNPLQVSDAIPI